TRERPIEQDFLLRRMPEVRADGRLPVRPKRPETIVDSQDGYPACPWCGLVTLVVVTRLAFPGNGTLKDQGRTDAARGSGAGQFLGQFLPDEPLGDKHMVHIAQLLKD